MHTNEEILKYWAQTGDLQAVYEQERKAEKVRYDNLEKSHQ